VGDTVEAVSRFAQGRGRGLYHVGGSEPVSRYAFGLAFARIFGLPEERFLPVRMEDVTMAAPRPRDCSLDTGKIFREIGLKPCGVEEGLRRQQAEETAAPVIRGTAP
jgi:dTDP-4-dehydrorhamnose reductase